MDKHKQFVRHLIEMLAEGGLDDFDILESLEDHGLIKYENYDPEKHANIHGLDDSGIGDRVWIYIGDEDAN